MPRRNPCRLRTPGVRLQPRGCATAGAPIQRSAFCRRTVFLSRRGAETRHRRKAAGRIVDADLVQRRQRLASTTLVSKLRLGNARREAPLRFSEAARGSFADWKQSFPTCVPKPELGNEDAMGTALPVRDACELSASHPPEFGRTAVSSQ